MTGLRIDEVQFVAGSEVEAMTGLLGYVSLTVNGDIRLDGVALRRTLTGKWALSYPARTDRGGRKHAFVRPLSDAVRREIESQVLEALGLEGDAAMPAPSQQANSRP